MKKTITLSFSVLLLCLMTEQASAMSLSLTNGFIFATSMKTNLIATAVLIPLIIILAFMAIKYPSLRYQKQADSNLEPENLDKPIEKSQPKHIKNQNVTGTLNQTALLKTEKQNPQIKQQSIAITETATKQPTNPVHIENHSEPKFIRYAARGLVVAGALLYYIAQQKAQEKKKRKK